MRTLLAGIVVLVLLIAAIGAVVGMISSGKDEKLQGAASGAIIGAVAGIHQGFGCLVWVMLIGIVLAIGRCVLQ